MHAVFLKIILFLLEGLHFSRMREVVLTQKGDEDYHPFIFPFIISESIDDDYESE